MHIEYHARLVPTLQRGNATGAMYSDT